MNSKCNNNFQRLFFSTYYFNFLSSLFIFSFPFDSKKQWIVNTENTEIDLLESESNQTKYLNDFDTENAEEYEIE